MATQTPIIRPTTTLIPRSPNIPGANSNKCCPISDNLSALHNELKKIEFILKSSSLLGKKLEDIERRKKEIENRRQKEKTAEKKVGTTSKIDLTPPAQTGGILQSINQFILMNLLAWATPKLIQFAPQISWVTKNVIYLSQFISKFTTEFFKNVVRSINFGYKVYDTTRKIVKNIGGENFEKVFDNTSSLLNKFLNGAIVVGLAIASSGSGSDGVSGDRRGGRGRQGGRGRPGVTSSDDFRNPLRTRPGVTSSGDVRNPFRTGPRVTVGGEANAARAGIRGIRGAFGKVAIIGPLIGFIIDLMMGEPVGRAAAGAVGSMIGAGIAAAIVGAGTLGIGAIVGGLIGGYIGDLIGTSLYDLVAPMVGWQVTTQAQGGSVGGKTSTNNSGNNTRRPRTRVKPSIKRFDRVQPGKNVGGEASIKKLYPDPNDDQQANPYKALVRTSEILKKNSFSALMAAGVDLALGQQVDKKIFRNFANQLNYMVESAYDPESYGVNSVSRQILTAANGGQIGLGSTRGIQRKNLSDEFYDSMISMVNMRSNDIFSDIRRNLSLKGIEETSTVAPTSGGGGGEGSPNLTGHTNARKVYNYLVNDLHFTPEAAAGILGNLLQESGAIDPRQKQNDGGGGKGILQWDSTRWGRMLSWAREKNKDPFKLETQLEWMTIEMKQRGTFNRIKGLTDVRKSVELFEREMEKAGIPMMENRYRYAANAYASFFAGAGGRTGQFASGAYISPKFDPDRQHTGLDMNLPGGIGTPIYAPRELIYKSRGTDGMPAVGLQGTPGVLGPSGSGFGYYGAYYYRGADGRLYEVLMGHFKNLPYKGSKDGEIIPQGTLLGYQGASGRTIGKNNGPYPHISLHINGVGFRANQSNVTQFANLLLNYNQNRGGTASRGRTPSSTSTGRSNPNTRPSSGTRNRELSGGNENAILGPQSSNITGSNQVAQLAPGSTSSSSYLSAPTTYTDGSKNSNTIAIQPIVQFVG